MRNPVSWLSSDSLPGKRPDQASAQRRYFSSFVLPYICQSSPVQKLPVHQKPGRGCPSPVWLSPSQKTPGPLLSVVLGSLCRIGSHFSPVRSISCCTSLSASA